MTPASGADANRLARAIYLEVAPIDAETWRVSGGTSEHIASVCGCDCADFTLRRESRKHILAVRLRLGDADTIRRLRELVPMPVRVRQRRADRPHFGEATFPKPSQSGSPQQP